MLQEKRKGNTHVSEMDIIMTERSVYLPNYGSRGKNENNRQKRGSTEHVGCSMS